MDIQCTQHSFWKSINKRSGQSCAWMNFLVMKMVTDASISYKLANFANITIGANNIGNTYPDKLKNFGNTGEGRFVYSRACYTVRI